MTPNLRRSSIKTLAILLISFLSACGTTRVPVPPGTIPQPPPPTPQEEAEGHQALEELTRQWELDYTHSRYQEVLKIVEKLTIAANVAQEAWHVFILKDDKFKNAAATKGNHVFVWTGMIDATTNEAELATILGHEIGHVLARHSNKDTNETIREALIEVGALAAGIAVAQITKNPTLASNAGKMTTQLTKQLGNVIAIYPYGRALELEADHIGLFLIAKAGYNPEHAIEFWQKASKDPSFGNGVAFLSTHPPAEERLEKLKLLFELYKHRTTTAQ
jgi:metalloendopeptidase OMA1, mitochondrial